MLAKTVVPKLVALAIAYASVLLQFSTAYELQQLVEFKCPEKMPQMAALDQDWVKSVRAWYYVRASKLDAYKSVGDALGIPVSQVPESDIYYRQCTNYAWDGNNEAALYMLGQRINIQQNMSAEGVLHWKIGPEYLGIGKSTMPLTDNKSYLYYYDCFKEGDVWIAAWGIMANTQVLTQEAIKEIDEFSRAQGFAEEHFIPLQYNSCKPLGLIKN